MKKLVYFTMIAMCLSLFSESIYGQIVITDNPPGTADPAAVLDVQSTSRGFLFPRMGLADRNNISSPPTGLVIFQTDNTPGFYYNTGTAGTPDWQRITDATTIGGYWTPGASNSLYYTAGNVGVGENSPSHQLHVNGASMFENDSVYITGRPGRIFLNGENGYEPMIRFSHAGTSEFRLRYRAADGSFPNDNFMINSDVADDLFGVNAFGTVNHTYIGNTNFAYSMASGAPLAALAVSNSNSDNQSFGYGIQVTVNNAPTGSPTPAAITSFIGGDGTAVYATNSNHSNTAWLGTQYQGVSGRHGTSLNTGSLGREYSGVAGFNSDGGTGTDYWGALAADSPGASNEYGAYGDNGDEPEPIFGGLGSSNHGAYGMHTLQHWGSLGSSSSGAYGEHADGHIGRLGYSDAGARGELASSNSDGEYGVKGYGVDSDDDDGSGFDYNETRGAVFGLNTAAAEYTFGVAGYTATGSTNTRRGGVFGGDAAANTWGALGYLRNTGPAWCAGYFSAAPVTGSANGNKSFSDPLSAMAISAYGDLFGAHINGSVYGLYAEGNNYSVFAKGDMYRTGVDVHLQQDNSGQNNVMYTLVSPEMTIQTYGIGQLSNGKAIIEFDDAFSNVVSANEPIVITITPIGESEGVHLEQVDGKGFRVAENRSGKSSVQFSWIAIGKRRGYENVSLPTDVISADYTNKIEEGLSNDGNPNETAGQGLYYQNGELHLGQAPGQPPASNINVERAAPEKKMNKIILPDETKSVPAEIEPAVKKKVADEKIK